MPTSFLRPTLRWRPYRLGHVGNRWSCPRRRRTNYRLRFFRRRWKKWRATCMQCSSCFLTLRTRMFTLNVYVLKISLRIWNFMNMCQEFMYRLDSYPTVSCYIHRFGAKDQLLFELKSLWLWIHFWISQFMYPRVQDQAKWRCLVGTVFHRFPDNCRLGMSLCAVERLCQERQGRINPWINGVFFPREASSNP